MCHLGFKVLYFLSGKNTREQKIFLILFFSKTPFTFIFLLNMYLAQIIKNYMFCKCQFIKLLSL